MGGRAQMARFRQPGAAAMVFMNTLVATEARFRVRARRARRPCSARAMPRDAKTRAAASGIAASRAAIPGRWRVASASWYWAVKLTIAAAAARAHRAAAAFRSHRTERSRPDADPGRGLGTVLGSRADIIDGRDRVSGKADTVAATSRGPADGPPATASLRGGTRSPAPSPASWTRGPRATRGLGYGHSFQGGVFSIRRANFAVMPGRMRRRVSTQLLRGRPASGRPGRPPLG